MFNSSHECPLRALLSLSQGTDIEPVLQEGAEGHDHSHGHGHDKAEYEKCACAAKKFNFAIDCTARVAMLDSLALLKSAGCATDCSSDACEMAYLIVQSHHDYCPEDKVPDEVEDGFHDYDTSCTPCEIQRSYITGAPNCPAAKCDNSGNDAYAALVDGGCQTDCSSDTCRDNFFILRVEHDLCAHDTLSRATEEGLHDMEKPCAKQLCNVEGAEKKAPTCDDHDDHGKCIVYLGFRLRTMKLLPHNTHAIFNLFDFYQMTTTIMMTMATMMITTTKTLQRVVLLKPPSLELPLH